MADEEKTASTDRALVNGAQMRAAISGFLSENLGQHAVKDVAKAINKDRKLVGPVLAEMAEGGLIHYRKSGLQKLYSWGEPASKAARAKPVKRHVVTEVEFVVGGTLIVMGRNPNTGRLRITLEEA